MSTDTLAIPDAKGELVTYDKKDQEPEFELYLRSARVEGSDPPRTEWRAAHVVEGEPHAELSQTQRQWMAAVLNHLAISMEGNLVLEGKPDPQRLFDLLRFRRQQMKALSEILYADVQGVVENQGVEFAAHALGVKPRQVRHLLKSKRLKLGEEMKGKRVVATIGGTAELYPEEDVLHLSPLGDSRITRCCKKDLLWQIPGHHQLTDDPALVSCKTAT